MSDQVASSVVRLIDQTGLVAGVGYLVPENRVITCAHMVALALGIPKESTPAPDSEVTIDFPLVERGKKRRARIISWRRLDPSFSLPLEGLEDVAVLEVVSDQQVAEPVGKTLTSEDYEEMIGAIKEGSLIPFLGAGVNLCDRPEGQAWSRDSHFLPSGEELSRALALEFGYPWPDHGDLLRVSQYVALMHTLKKLYESLRRIFDREYTPTSLHQFFAKLPRLLRERNYPSTCMMITTNYDDLLETAFRNADQPYDLVTYWVGDQGELSGKLVHWTADGRPNIIKNPQYQGIKVDDDTNPINPVILKIHGAVDRNARKGVHPRDSYVITEDNYLEYLTRSDIVSLVPKTLKPKLEHSGFLFLGYSLRDWNLRVFLNRIHIRQKQELTEYKSWAIQRRPAELEQRFWDARKVTIFDADLRQYVKELDERINSQPPR